MTFFAVIGWLVAGVAAVAAWRWRGARARVTAEQAALRDRTRALIADAEASVRRIREESERSRPFAAEPVLRDLLEVMDNLDRALASGDGGEGLALIHRQSAELLQRHGATRIPCLDLPFDPTAHEAVATEPAPGPPDRVLHELSAGYQLHTRLLRAARVVVAVPVPAEPPEPS